eukprot:scaffold63810_cov55-Phaeocystis_antarctica.AAC.2
MTKSFLSRSLSSSSPVFAGVVVVDGFERTALVRGISPHPGDPTLGVPGSEWVYCSAPRASLRKCARACALD